jgi:RNA polymerase sigma factor (sigma-70 family)
MITAHMKFTPASISDADLVQSSLTGNSGAFSEIVVRYQTLVCSLAYNATGSLSRSEDLAQEIFLTAWKELRQLREPAKFRSWLCGIARRLTANTRRREGREPVCAAEELEDAHHVAGPGPAEQTISREEEAILWRSLEQIPETYREPLILYYREGESLDYVAAALDLTEETARQRLSRGRKMLQEQVAQFVEGALRQSTPGRAFTLGVIAALPLMTTSASAAAIGTAAAKSGTATTGAGLLAMLGVLLGPIIGCLGAWFGVKASLESAESDRERQLIRRQTRQMMALVITFLVVLFLGICFQTRIWKTPTEAAIVLSGVIPVVYLVSLVAMMLHFWRARSRLRAEEGPRRDPREAARQAEAWKTFEYKSQWTLLGLPLVHVRSGRPFGAKLHPAVGWIAVGDVSIGVLVSVGGFAVGGISIGGCSLGLLAMGGISLGAIAVAGLAFGLWAATGGLAIGYLAHGGCAVAWHAAEGGMAAARDFAVGDTAYAAHANDVMAREAIGSSRFFHAAEAFLRQPLWFSVIWLPLLLVIWQAKRALRVLKPKVSSLTSNGF